MGGLLDFTSDPQGMQGLALLAAAAPSMAPMNFAGRLAQAGNNYQGLLGEQLKQQLGKAQLDDVRQQIGLRGIQLQQAQQQFEMMKPILGAVAAAYGGQGAAGGQMPSQPAVPASPGGALGSGTFGVPMGGQPASSPPAGSGGTPGSIFGVPMNVAGPTLALGGPAKFAETISQFNAPTDFMKLLAAAGIDPRSEQGQALLSGQIKKQNNIPLQAGRAGAPMYNPDGTIAAMAPKIPDNAVPQIVDGRVVGVSPLPGAASVAQINAFAGAAGKNQAEPMPAFRGNQPVFTNKLAAATGGATPQAGAAGAFDLNDPALLSSINDIKDPQERASAFAALQSQLLGGGAKAPIPAAGAVTPAPALGAEKGATLSQSELSDKGKSLMADNANTNTVISRLQNIKMLTPGAITGAESGRRDFLNGLLSLAGIQGATDAKTASDLVDKNSAQIVSALRLGQGGAGTDALQTLLGAANPNRHMTKDAINEAADQLIASQKMVQAKAQLLQPHYLGRDPVAYGAKELQFDQNADPRVWQLQAMNPQQQAAYVKTLPPAVAADVLQKRRALKQLGVLQ